MLACSVTLWVCGLYHDHARVACCCFDCELAPTLCFAASWLLSVMPMSSAALPNGQQWCAHNLFKSIVLHDTCMRRNESRSRDALCCGPKWLAQLFRGLLFMRRVRQVTVTCPADTAYNFYLHLPLITSQLPGGSIIQTQSVCICS